MMICAIDADKLSGDLRRSLRQWAAVTGKIRPAGIFLGDYVVNNSSDSVWCYAFIRINDYPQAKSLGAPLKWQQVIIGNRSSVGAVYDMIFASVNPARIRVMIEMNALQYQHASKIADNSLRMPLSSQTNIGIGTETNPVTK